MSLATVIEHPLRLRNPLVVPVDRKLLAHPVLVQETNAQRFMRRLCLVIGGGVVAFVGWASIAQVQEVSQASGAIVPSGFERVVQHFEGGIVQQILVHAGDRVEIGTPLFILDDAATAEDVDVATRQQRSLLVQLEGLDALADGRRPDFASYGDDASVKASEAVYAARSAERASQQKLVESQIAQARILISTYDTQLKGLQNDRAFAAENFERMQSLYGKGYATTAQLAERRKAQQDVENDIEVTLEKKSAAAEKLGEAEKSLNAFLASAKSEVATQAQDLRGTLTAVGGDVSRKKRRQERLTVRSPIKGVVKALNVTTVGGVVGAGQPLATIVPSNETLYADTRLPVSQIGYVRQGMPVQVKLSAFDFTRFGWLEGKVASISPSSFASPGEAPYYQVRVSLNSDVLPLAPDARLVPGMAVSADIITDHKSILSYFLSPIRKALNTSFVER